MTSNQGKAEARRHRPNPRGDVSEEAAAEYITAILRASQRMIAGAGPKAVSAVTSILREAIFCFWETRDRHMDDATRPRSVEASGAERPDVTYDHVIPIGVVVAKLLELQPDPASVQAFLREYVRTCWITREENTRLEGAGLRQSMPEGWAWGADPLERYRKVGIAVAHLRGTDGLP